MIVSVVIPTYQRPDLLARCLDALLVQEFDPTTFEIIVVDDAPDPATQDLVMAYANQAVAYTVRPRRAKKAAYAGNEPIGERTGDTAERSGIYRLTGVPRIRYIPVTGEHGPAAARNAGWRAAESEIIAFTDDDTLPAPGWLRAGVGAFRGDVVGVSGKISMPITEPPTDYERDAAGLERSEFVTANCFYRKEALQACGGFDTRFKLAWREDTDLFFELLERNARLVSETGALVVHPVREADWGVSIKQQKKSIYNALLYKKHPGLYRQRVQSGPPWLYYAILLSVLAVIPGWILGGLPLALAAMAAWLALTGWFCLKRLTGTSHSRKHIAEMAITSFLIPPLSVFWRVRGALKFRVFFL